MKFQFIKPKKIDFKPRRTKAKGRGGTAKIVKSKKALKDLAKKVRKTIITLIKFIINQVTL